MFGTERIGSGQRQVLDRMLENDGVWNPDWYMYGETSRRLAGLQKKGVVEFGYPPYHFGGPVWFITPKFVRERLNV